MERIVFVYAKEGKIKVLEIERAKILQEELKAGGWEHTVTIDVTNWIEYLHNTCTDFESEVKHLSGERILRTPAENE